MTLSNSCRTALLLAAVVAAPGTLVAQSGDDSEALIVQVAKPGETDAETLEILEELGFAWEAPGDLVGPAVAAGLLGAQGDGNTAVVDQRGTGNVVSIVQSGSRNVAAVYQEGSANWVRAVQEGNGNLFGAWLVGSSNALELVQRGDDNRYLLDFVGDDLSHQVVQIGNGLRAVQYGEGSLPFGIRQEGTGMEIRIEHGGGS